MGENSQMNTQLMPEVLPKKNIWWKPLRVLHLTISFSNPEYFIVDDRKIKLFIISGIMKMAHLLFM